MGLLSKGVPVRRMACLAALTTLETNCEDRVDVRDRGLHVALHLSTPHLGSFGVPILEAV